MCQIVKPLTVLPSKLSVTILLPKPQSIKIHFGGDKTHRSPDLTPRTHGHGPDMEQATPGWKEDVRIHRKASGVRSSPLLDENIAECFEFDLLSRTGSDGFRK
ncbi:TPA: hypothetical protein EYN23_21185 [Candidatus Poribacteria bacterium]|nr:hypothetical protein [Candidatus Poribacteria bacterium]